MDNFYSGHSRNVRHLASSKRFRLIEGDVSRFDTDGKLDAIFHLACPASPVHYQKDPVFTWKTAVFGTYRMLELAKRHEARLVIASTSEVYGDPKIHPQTEAYVGHVNPVGIRSCYDEGKRAGESIAFDFKRCKGLDVGVARIFNTYGPGMSAEDGRVIGNFVTQALRNENLTVYGDGSQTRSFCYVSDLVEGLIAMLEKKGFAGPINLGNPSELKVVELAETVLRMVASRSAIRFKELPLDDPSRRRPDIALARKELGWSPDVPLEKGLLKTVEYFRRLLG